MPKISVVVSCYNKSETIRDCVTSVLQQDIGEFETIVVDDGSTDGSLQILTDLAFENSLKLVAGEHRGISSTKNRGFASSNGEIVLFLDGDCVLEKGSLEELTKSFDGGAVDCVGGEVRAVNSSRSIARAVEIMQNDIERKWPFGANVAYSRKAFLKAGLFDERMTAGEDAELYLRARKLGFKSIINGKVVARTKNPDNPVSFFCQRLNWGKGFRQLTERHPETFTTKIKLCFLWILVMLLSPLVAMIDIQFTWAFPALAAYNLLRFTPGTIAFYRRTRDRKHCIIIPFLRFVNALAYFLGWICWYAIELAGRAKALDPFLPEPAGDNPFPVDLPT